MRLFPQNKKNRNKVSNHSSTDSSVSKSNSHSNIVHKNKEIADTVPPAAAAEPSLKTRRIVKATTPTSAPPATTASSSSFHSRNTESSSDELRMVHDDDNIRIPERSFVGIKAPAVQQEELQEKVQQWRKERLEASAAIRKEHKEKEIKEHRMRNLTSSSLESHDDNHVEGEQDDQHDHDDNSNSNSNSNRSSGGDQGGLEKKKVLKHKEPTSHQDRRLSIFSVLTKFPEHKRKKASHDHDTFKKLKTAEEELQELSSKKEEDNGADIGNGTGIGTGNMTGKDDNVDDDAATESWSTKALQVVKSSTPVAGVVVAVLAIFITRWMRK